MLAAAIKTGSTKSRPDLQFYFRHYQKKDHGEIRTEVNDTKPEYLMSSLNFLGFKGSRCEYESRQVVSKL